jgi:LacI family transcriptional regulator
LLGGIESYLLQTEYQFFVASHRWSATRVNRIAELFLERGAEGVILINSDAFPGIDLPMVRIGRHDPPVKGTSIIVDNYAGALAAMQYLHSLGHNKLAFIKGHEDSVDTVDRWRAVVQAARDLSIPINPSHVVELERLGVHPMAPVEEGMRCAEKLLPYRSEFTALMTFNDISAIGAITRFREAGWNVPSDLSVVGFDDVFEACITYPSLTTVQQPLRLMGETAAREIIEGITNGARDNEIVFTPKLIVRNSTAPARAQHRSRHASLV